MIEKKENIKKLIIQLGFLPEENSKGIFYKKYTNHKNYIIKLHIDKGEIEYGNKIILGDKTTSNFKANENFVVLECVNRLLEKGYSPENITLEKDYPLGHKTKGKLDVLVTDKEGKSYLMIECKTWGAEYEKATKKTLNDGGQLLSYFQQDKSSKYLSLYTSKIENNSISYKNGIIKVEEDFLQTTNTQEVFEKWNKNLKNNGIFENWATPYNIAIKAITKGILEPLTKEDSSRIFNQFAEILRHNVVSDKPNAFNKLITLLLCKIVDEDKANNEELHFQWLENDTDIDLQKRLNDLYKTGMQKYLTKVVTDYSDSDVEEIVGLNETQKDIIKKMMTELRLKKNNEFAFKEVYNDASFIENGRVLKEVVELLQPYQVRYNKKQQFLGDFFELLLNTSIKQEAGQYFTPVPVARFIVNSIPLRKIILDKINNGEPEFLPYVIDYAVGSGHFITEAMDEIHNAIVDFNDNGDFKPSVKKKLKTWSDDAAFEWAYDFVYGIEKDYRLVKTAKVSCFLNGDGLARIFNADGLGNFKSDSDYKDKLKITSKTDTRDNQEFEVLIANPPYSVSSFKNTLLDGEKSFELYNRLTDESSEIECLFIERTKQLLKEDGYAGIILPSSILSNSGIYSDARDILLKYFKIVAITEFGSNTFMATGTNTVTLFLQRRNNSEWQKVQHTVNNFFNSPVDVTCNGIENPFSKYVAHVYKTISFNDYVSFVNKNPNEKIKENELYKDYHKDFFNSTFVKNLIKKPVFKTKPEAEQLVELDRMFYLEVFAKEREKLLFFILAYSQKTLLIKANPDGKNETEKEFLGYEFSNRRGHEGIRPYGAKTIQQSTKLYDETNLLNSEKVNSYILNAFEGNEININQSLQNHISQRNLVDLMNFDRVVFEKSISLSIKKKVEIESKWELKTLNEICNVKIGGTPPRQNPEFYEKGQYLWVSISEMKGGLILDTKEKINESGIKNSNVKLIKKGTTLLSFKLSIGKTAIAGKDLYTNEAIAGLEIREDFLNEVSNEYLFSIFNNKIIDLEKSDFNAFGKSLNSTYLKTVLIPLPPKNIQEKIVKEIEIIELKEKITNENLKNNQEKIIKLLQNTTVSSIYLLGNIAKNLDHLRKPVTKSKRNKGIYPYYGASGLVDFVDDFVLDDTVLLVSEDGANLKSRVTPIAFTVSGKAWVNNHAHILKFDNSTTHKLVEYYLNNLNLDNFITGMAQPKLNQANLNKIPISLPPIKEQEKIVSQIEKIETEIATLQKQLESIATEKQNVLKKYL